MDDAKVRLNDILTLEQMGMLEDVVHERILFLNSQRDILKLGITPQYISQLSAVEKQLVDYNTIYHAVAIRSRRDVK